MQSIIRQSYWHYVEAVRQSSNWPQQVKLTLRKSSEYTFFTMRWSRSPKRRESRSLSLSCFFQTLPSAKSSNLSGQSSLFSLLHPIFFCFFFSLFSCSRCIYVIPFEIVQWFLDVFFVVVNFHFSLFAFQFGEFLQTIFMLIDSYPGYPFC